MDVIESGITIDARPVQLAKAAEPMDVIESGIPIDERLKHGTHCTTPRGLLLVMLVSKTPKPRQLGKACWPMDVIESGITIDARLVQP